MNAATSFYLIVTCAGLAAVITSPRVTDSNRRGFAVFVITGSLALAALSGFFLINRLTSSAMSNGGPIYVAGVPLNLSAMYALSALGCAAVAAHALWSSKHSSGQAI
jgi:hypothetical protein